MKQGNRDLGINYIKARKKRWVSFVLKNGS